MLTPEQADRFAHEWLAAWNAHDLERILAHYAEDVEFTSPFIVRVLGDPAGLVRGKAALRSYFARGLAAYPELWFTLRRVYPGVRSVVLEYESVNALLAAEVMELDAHGEIRRVQAHYRAPAAP